MEVSANLNAILGQSVTDQKLSSAREARVAHMDIGLEEKLRLIAKVIEKY